MFDSTHIDKDIFVKRFFKTSTANRHDSTRIQNPFSSMFRAHVQAEEEEEATLNRIFID